MKKHNLVLAFILLVLVAVILYLINVKKLARPIQPLLPEIVTSTNVGASQSPINPSTSNTNNVPDEPPRFTSPAEMGAWERAMDKKDVYWEYKLPISFYGKVVDDLGQPITGADIGFVWTDLSEAGTSKSSTQSDTAGLFYLTGVTGQGLSVYVSKEGYKLYHSSNRSSFEYSPLANPDRHYAPAPNNPVIFVMHKDGPREPLMKVNRRFPASTNQPTIFNLSGDASTSVRIDVLQNQSEKAGKGGAWMIQISVPNGGIQVSTNEFPIEAPETGYEPSIVVDRGTAKPTTWILAYGGGQFFVKTATGYGMMQLEMMMGSPHLQILSYFNPNNSRNLQP